MRLDKGDSVVSLVVIEESDDEEVAVEEKKEAKTGTASKAKGKKSGTK